MCVGAGGGAGAGARLRLLAGRGVLESAAELEQCEQHLLAAGPGVSATAVAVEAVEHEPRARHMRKQEIAGGHATGGADGLSRCEGREGTEGKRGVAS